MIPLTNKEIKSYEKQKVCHICKKEFFDDKNNEKEFKNKKKTQRSLSLHQKSCS